MYEGSRERGAPKRSADPHCHPPCSSRRGRSQERTRKLPAAAGSRAEFFQKYISAHAHTCVTHCEGTAHNRKQSRAPASEIPRYFSSRVSLVNTGFSRKSRDTGGNWRRRIETQGLTGGSSTRVCARGGGRERTDRVVRVACAAHRAASATAGEWMRRDVRRPS